MSNSFKIFSFKLIKVSAVILVLLAIIFRMSAQIMGAEKYHQQVVNQLAIATGKQVKVNGELSLRTVPIFNRAHIIIPNIVIDDANSKTNHFMEAEKIIIHASLLEFLIGKVEIKSIDIHNAKINFESILYSDNSYYNNWSFLSSNNVNNFSLDNLQIFNSQISYTSQNDTKKIEDVNLILKVTNNINIKGKAKYEDEILDIDFNLLENNKDNQKIEAKISSQGMKANFKGNISEEKNNFGFAGDIDIKLNKPSFLKNIISNITPFLSPLVRTDFKEELSIQSALIFKDSTLDLKNLSISSSRTSGKGDIKTNFVDGSSYVKLNFSILDTSEFIAYEGNNLIGEITNKSLSDISETDDDNNKVGYLNFSLIDQQNISIFLDINKFILPHFSLNNLSFDFSTKTGKVKAGDIYFEIEENNYKTKFQLNNFNFKKVDDIYLLLGNFTNEGNNIQESLKILELDNFVQLNAEKLNYKFDSQVIISPKEISLFNINGKIGDDGIINGSIASTHDDMNHYNIDLKINNLNIHSIDLPLIQERLSTLIKKSNEDDYLSYFRWFRTLDSSYRLKFDLTNSVFNNNSISKLKAVCKLMPGSMVVQTDLISNFADGTYRVELAANQIKPSLDIQVNSNQINLKTFQLIINNFINPTNNKTDINLPALANTDSNDSIDNENNFNLFRIHKYNANFDFSVLKLQTPTKEINNLRLIGHTSNKILYLDTIYLQIYDGELQTQGNISFYDQILYQFSFNSALLNLKNILQDISPYEADLDGTIGATGSLVTQGENFKNILQNLVLSIRVASPLINVSGINCDEMIDIALKRKPAKKEEVLNIIDNYLNNGNTELLQIDGTFNSNKGVITTNNLMFKTRFSNAVLALTLDLNNLNYSSNAAFYFTPYTQNKPISFSILKSGNLKSKPSKQIDKDELIKYAKQQYGIVTDEDIALQKRKEEEQKKLLAQDPDNKDYLFYKLEQMDTPSKKSSSGDIKFQEKLQLKTYDNINPSKNTNFSENKE